VSLLERWLENVKASFYKMIKALWWGYQWASSCCGNVLSMEQTVINSKKLNATFQQKYTCLSKIPNKKSFFQLSKALKL
jgi:hypothetical protein